MVPNVRLVEYLVVIVALDSGKNCELHLHLGLLRDFRAPMSDVVSPESLRWMNLQDYFQTYTRAVDRFEKPWVKQE